MPKEGQGHRMSSSLCNIALCANSKKLAYSPTIFYRTPKDPDWATLWQRALQKHVSKTHIKNAVICSKHFLPSAFERFSKILKKSAVPTVFPSEDETLGLPQKQDTEPQIAQAGSSRKSRLLKSSEPETTLPQVVKLEPAFVEQLEKEKKQLLEMIERLKQRKEKGLEQLKKLEDADDRLTGHLASLKQTCDKKRQEYYWLLQTDKEVLRKCFSEAQVKRLTTKSREVSWSDKDSCVAYAISSLTTREFKHHLTTYLKFPLPSKIRVPRGQKSS